jgi:hypothetical protein
MHQRCSSAVTWVIPNTGDIHSQSDTDTAEKSDHAGWLESFIVMVISSHGFVKTISQ